MTIVTEDEQPIICGQPTEYQTDIEESENSKKWHSGTQNTQIFIVSAESARSAWKVYGVLERRLRRIRRFFLYLRNLRDLRGKYRHSGYFPWIHGKFLFKEEGKYEMK